MVTFLSSTIDTATKYKKETYGNVFLKNYEPNYKPPFYE